MLVDAARSIPDNLREIGSQLADPLGLDLGDLSDTSRQAAQQDVQINTIGAMQQAFSGQLGAFAYLLFILLYMPCVATIGVIYKEIGSFWAVFSVNWSFIVAYGCAVIVYQAGTFTEHPTTSLLWVGAISAATIALFSLLVVWGKHRQTRQLIPVKLLD
jgi:ferrous iron transport protein B